MMNKLIRKILCSFVLLIATGFAEVAPVTISIPEPQVWTGQRLPLYVDLRSSGSFAGATYFDLPDIPGSIILKVGNALVSSEEIEGAQWSIQRHEFALFSQRTGPLTIPEFKVRFGTRDGFTGPEIPREESVPSAKVEIKRPPGSEDHGFLITTESLSIEETWDTQPSVANVGDIFKRTIIQRAPNITGMALAPAPQNVPDGMRLYPPKFETNDKLDRGEFLGERRETLTYQLRAPGTLTLPALKYVWWNPKTEILESKTLPAVTFDVVALPIHQQAVADEGSVWKWAVWAAIVGGLGIASWKRRECVNGCRRMVQKLNPPHRVAARRLLAACGRSDADGARKAWSIWRNHVTLDQPSDDLKAALLELDRTLYGSVSGGEWQGGKLAVAFRAQQKGKRLHDRKCFASPLPELNAQDPEKIGS